MKDGIKKKILVRFDVFTEVTMKNAVFWHMIMPCGSCKHRSFGGTLKMDVIYFPETSVLTRITRPHHIPKYSLLRR
jgi:hypothetical protein